MKPIKSASFRSRNPELFGIFLILSIWTVIAWHTIKTLYWTGGAYASDPYAHLEYVQRMAQLHRFLAPHETYQSYHPPLYYLVAQLFSPLSLGHIERMRTLSALFGAGFITTVYISLRNWVHSVPLRVLAGIFCATLPSFAVLFTSYNNDSLGVLLSVVSLALTIRYLSKPNKYLLALATIILALAFYTKFTSFYLIIVYALLSLIMLWRKSVPRIRLRNLWIGIGIAIVLFSPWVIGHNYRQTGKLFPTNFEDGRGDLVPADLGVAGYLNPWNLTAPGQWYAPYQYGAWTD